MCDIGGDYDGAEIYVRREVAARRAYVCSECELRIAKGTRHAVHRFFDEGSWSVLRTHTDCAALVEHVALVVCGQRVTFYGLQPIRDRVREHYREAPEVLRMYRDVLRARRAEGVWPVRRAG
jgi:uncharacterized protein YlaI